jgi:AraC-like DNA-binding protein
MFSEPLISLKSLLLLAGVFNASIAGLYLLRKKDRHASRNWPLLFLMSILSIIVLEHAYQYSALYRRWPAFLYISSPFYFLIGPAFLFYLKSIVQAKNTWRKHDLLHLLPFLFFIYYMFPQYVYPRDNMIAFTDGFFSGSVQVNANYLVVLIAYKIHFIIYLVWSHRFVGNFISDYKRQLANDAVEQVDQLYPILMYLNVYFSFSLVSTFFINADRTFYLGADFANLFLLSCFLHLAAYFTFRHKQTLPVIEPIKYERSKISDTNMAALKAQIETHMLEQKPYLNQQLKLADLAADLSIGAHQLSQVFNDGFGLSFYDYINGYRIAAAKRLLQAETHKHFSLTAIAEEVGFNSYVSFYRVFKKVTGKTPSELQK